MSKDMKMKDLHLSVFEMVAFLFSEVANVNINW